MCRLDRLESFRHVWTVWIKKFWIWGTSHIARLMPLEEPLLSTVAWPLVEPDTDTLPSGVYRFNMVWQLPILTITQCQSEIMSNHLIQSEIKETLHICRGQDLSWSIKLILPLLEAGIATTSTTKSHCDTRHRAHALSATSRILP